MSIAKKYLKNGRVDFDEFFSRNLDEFDPDDFAELVKRQREDRALWKESQDRKGKDE